ncbi:MAG: hypothetical protein QXX18_07170 [Candidatus Jordarchaeales archaeon]
MKREVGWRLCIVVTWLRSREWGRGEREIAEGASERMSEVMNE